MQKKLYITTAIPYVNSTPHIGNAMDYLLADIWARYQKQNGREVRFSAGTDEHGNKIAAKAAEEGIDPKTYTDKMYVNFENLMKKVGAEYTDFVRTTDLNHRAAVQYIWQKLQPYIYKAKYEGWYCVGCEAFVSDKEAAENNGVCPIHNQPYQRLSEENYYFKASSFTDKLKQAYESGRIEIVPDFRRKEFMELIKDGLQDVSISRPKKSLSWGIEVPGDPNNVMYVWLDALSNYITALGYPNKPDWENYWPADVQVLGKDILRFHAGLWPAMLLGLELPLPIRLFVHGHVNVGGVKMSKSVGNVIDPNQLIDQYGRDAFRYYFTRHIPTMDDGDFTWEKFETVYNNELANDLGNLVSRIASMISNYQAGVIGDFAKGEHDMDAYHDAMNNLSFDRAISDVWDMVQSLNQYIETVKPWQIAKKRETDPDAAAHLNEVLAYMASAILQIADLLVPFLPDAAAKIHKVFESGAIVPLETVMFPKIYNHTQAPTSPKA